jgi:hypothetical protein
MIFNVNVEQIWFLLDAYVVDLYFLVGILILVCAVYFSLILSNFVATNCFMFNIFHRAIG